jgi:hypothetical protein
LVFDCKKKRGTLIEASKMPGTKRGIGATQGFSHENKKPQHCCRGFKAVVWAPIASGRHKDFPMKIKNPNIAVEVLKLWCGAESN